MAQAVLQFMVNVLQQPSCAFLCVQSLQFTVVCAQACFGPYQDEAGGVFKDDGFELKSNPMNCGKLLALAKLLKSFLQEGSKVSHLQLTLQYRAAGLSGADLFAECPNAEHLGVFCATEWLRIPVTSTSAL